MIFIGTWSQYWRSVIGTTAQIILLGLSIILFTRMPKFSLLWWFGVIDFTIIGYLTMMINNRFIVNNDKEMENENLER